MMRSRLAVIAITVAIGVFALWLLREVVPVIALAAVYAIMTWPAVHRMERRIPRGAAILATDLVVAASALLVVLAFAPALYAQLQALVGSLPQAFTGMLERLPPIFQSAIGSALREFDVSLSAALRAAFNASVGLFRSASSVVAALVVIPVLAAYLQMDKERYRGWLFAALPPQQHERWRRALPAIGEAVGNFVRGQLIVSAVVGVLVYFVLLVCGVPFAGGIAVLTALFDVVPYLGGFAAFVPSLLFALTANGPGNAIVVALLLVLVFELEAQVLGPQIVGAKTQLPPSLILIVLLVGGTLFGIVGLYLAVPFAAAVAAAANALQSDNQMPVRTPVPHFVT